MVKVAIAGATSTFGREVADAILAKGKHEVVALTRRDMTDADTPGIKWTTVDYDYISEIVDALEGCEVVLCFFGGRDQATVVDRQKNLIDAAITAGVRRFAPSEWAMKSNFNTMYWDYKEEIREYLEEVNQSEKVLEYTLFQTGLRTDFFGHPHKGSKHFESNPMYIDFEHRRAIIVGDGDYPLVLTTVQDVAAVVAEAVDFAGEWPIVGGIRGSRTTMAEILKIGESLRGPFTVEEVSEEDIRAFKLDTEWVPELPVDITSMDSGIPRFAAQQSIFATITGAWDTTDEWNKLLPELSFTSPKEYLEKIWKDKP